MLSGESQRNEKSRRRIIKLSKTLAVAFILIGCIATFGQKNEEKLKIGVYLADALEKAESDSFGSSYGESSYKFKIEIKSIDGSGNVKAEFRGSGGRNGKLSGKLDATGNLQLEGNLVTSDKTIWETKIKATVKDDSLTDGKYILRNSRGFRIVGRFKVAIIIEDEDEDW